MTPEMIAAARSRVKILIMDGNYTPADYLTRALDALEASRRECEELRAENRLFIRVGREVQRKAKDLFEAAMGAPC